MSRLSKTVGAVLVAVLAAFTTWQAAQSAEETPAQEPGPAVTIRVDPRAADWLALLDEIPTRPEVNDDGYDRDEWRHWVSVSDDPKWRPVVRGRSGCDTREGVLIRDGWKVRTGKGCRIVSGTWRTNYDQRRHTSPATIQMDHIVPLKEAHESGAASWPAAKKEEFANDPLNVVASTGSLNSAKGNKDIAEWRPEYDRCGYVAAWVLIKQEYGLSMDALEKQTARRILTDPACQKGHPVR